MQELTEIGEDEPSDISGGRQTWKLTLEEQIPPDETYSGEDSDGFMLTVSRRDGSSSTYTGCRWVSRKQNYTHTGLHCVRIGTASGMKEQS